MLIYVSVRFFTLHVDPHFLFPLLDRRKGKVSVITQN